jgi:hypothetical protein
MDFRRGREWTKNGKSCKNRGGKMGKVVKMTHFFWKKL